MKPALAQWLIKTGLRKVTRIMRANGWLHVWKRRPKGLTKADPLVMQTENLIKQDFTAEEPYRKLLTDITQTSCADGTLCISPILDCFNGEILSLKMKSNLRKEWCVDLVKAIERYPLRGCILHSDRGNQYTSKAFRETLSRMSIKHSLSGVDHCYDNARMESFFATLKKELLYRIPTYRTKMENVKIAVLDISSPTTTGNGYTRAIPAVFLRQRMRRKVANWRLTRRGNLDLHSATLRSAPNFDH